MMQQARFADVPVDIHAIVAGGQLAAIGMIAGIAGRITLRDSGTIITMMRSQPLYSFPAIHIVALALRLGHTPVVSLAGMPMEQLTDG
jgi:hypothetical protein